MIDMPAIEQRGCEVIVLAHFATDSIEGKHWNSRIDENLRRDSKSNGSCLVFLVECF